MEIGIIIPVYNSGDLLLRAIESLDKQSDGDFSVCIVDDSSQDIKTKEILKGLEKRLRTKVVYCKKNKGPANARNVGIQNLDCDICIPLDSDDVLPPKVVEITKKEFEINKDIDFIFGNYSRIEKEKNENVVVNCQSIANNQGFLDARALIDKYILIGCSPFKKFMWQKSGGYRKRSFRHEDVDFWFTMLRYGAKGKYINEILYEWHRSSNGRNANSTEWEIFLSRFYNFALYVKVGINIPYRILKKIF